MIGSTPSARGSLQPTGGRSSTQRRPAWLVDAPGPGAWRIGSRRTPARANRLRAVLHDYHVELLALLALGRRTSFSISSCRLRLRPARSRGSRPSGSRSSSREHRVRRVAAQEIVIGSHRPPVPAACRIVEASVSHVLVSCPGFTCSIGAAVSARARIERCSASCGAEDPAGQTSEHRDVLILDPCLDPGDTIAAICCAEAYGELRARDYALLRPRVARTPSRTTPRPVRPNALRVRSPLRNAMRRWAMKCHAFERSPTTHGSTNHASPQA